ncbi:MAG: DsbA family protein [Pseudomonadota bacterium]
MSIASKLSATLVGIHLALAAPVSAEAPSELIFDDATREALHGEIRSYLLENPEILMELYALLEERQQAASDLADEIAVSENATEIFEDGYSFLGGNPEGDFTIVEFVDYQCGFCRRAHPEIAELISTDGEIRWIIKEFPILGPNSELAARAAISTQINLGEEAYLRLHNAIMETNGPLTDRNLNAVLLANDLDPSVVRDGMDAQEVTDRIAANRALAERMSISGTPTFVFQDEMVRGYMPLEQMQAMIADKRRAIQ